MRSHKRDQAAVSVIVPKGGIRGNDGAQAGGLMGRESIASAVSCAIARCRAILSVLVRMNGRRRGNLLVSPRRTIAASCFARGVSFGGSRIHGVIASAFVGALHPKFLTGSRAGGFRACRNLGRGISTPHGLPSPWKGGAVLQAVQGALAMMRTLSRNVSTAFPSIPEPTFLPVQSCHKRAEERPQVNTFTDVADGAEGLLQRAQAAYRAVASLPSAVARAELRARVSDCLAELIAFCREVESLPAGQNLKEARHG